MIVSILFSLVLIITYIVDLVFVPKDVKINTFEHIVKGDEKGYITNALMLKYSSIKKGQVWRLISSVFLHSGIFHLLSNVLALLIIGGIIEYYYCAFIMLFCFFLSSFISALYMCFIYKLECGIGASTGIYGLIIYYILMCVSNNSVIIPNGYWILILMIAIYAICGMFLSKTTRIEHITGMIGGVVSYLIIFIINYL